MIQIIIQDLKIIKPEVLNITLCPKNRNGIESFLKYRSRSMSIYDFLSEKILFFGA